MESGRGHAGSSVPAPPPSRLPGMGDETLTEDGNGRMDRRLFLAGSIGTVMTLLSASPSAADRLLRMRDLYNKDLTFSDFAEAKEGERVSVRGFMAPPLKADSRFFVLTKMPMAVCPFCETEAEWPDDILAIYTKRPVEVVPYNAPITTTGRLELGGQRDPETGFVSRIRLVDATYDRR